MLWLSNEAIAYAVAKCRKEPGYKVCIASNSRARRMQIELCVRNCLQDSNDFRVSGNMRYDMWFEFCNGSSIKIIPATDNSRGYKTHLLVADKDIDDDVLNCILRPCEILENMERYRQSCVDETLIRNFRKEYSSQSMKLAGVLEEENSGNDSKEFPNVSESELNKILNI